MTKRSPDERLQPPPPPRAREAMVTIDLDSQVGPVAAETLTVLPHKVGMELPFRTTPPRPSEPPPAPSVPPPAPPLPPHDATSVSRTRSVPPPSAAAPSQPLASARPAASPGGSPWIGARLRPAEVPLPSTPTEVAPPAMLSADGASNSPNTLAVRRSEPRISDGPLDGQHLEWLGCRAEKAGRVRAGWHELLEEAGERSAADQLRAAFEPVSAPSPSEARRTCHRVLVAGSCHALSLLKRVWPGERSTDDEEPPLRLVTGELRLAFDELETLRATVSAVAPHLDDDEALAKAVAPAKRMLEDPSLQGSRDAASDLASRIRVACQQSSVIEDAVVARRVERTLVEARAYAYRSVLGAKWARAVLVHDGVAVTCYVPEALAATLPLYASFSARVIGEILPRQDHDEESAVAIAVVALGRLIERGDDGWNC
jgi:hypothetical protein